LRFELHTARMLETNMFRADGVRAGKGGALIANRFEPADPSRNSNCGGERYNK
jgi:hypothetical protein